MLRPSGWWSLALILVPVHPGSQLPTLGSSLSDSLDLRAPVHSKTVERRGYRETQLIREGSVIEVVTERLNEHGVWRVTERREPHGDTFVAVRYEAPRSGRMPASERRK